ncbi:unnamed protein product [Prorocentrum cordatum]|uniref:Uncharacterized protein n=1 Tax=Prorocentrum cordatum TaxID=2364126 RepID=A0ABN9Q7G6_9DINO|nr:unnamed protein product [Polarella glacialis]
MLDAMMCLSLTDSAARLSGTEALPARGPSAWWNVRRVSGRLTLRPRQRHTVGPGTEEHPFKNREPSAGQAEESSRVPFLPGYTGTCNEAPSPSRPRSSTSVRL